jgi:ribosomal protein S14
VSVFNPKLQNGPIDKRSYKFKKASIRFFCPLCNSERAIVNNFRISRINIVQIFLTSLFLILVSYPFLKMGSFFSLFIVWGAVEFFKRTNYRKEIPCPHCGFDASWYKKDVKVARKLVRNFWLEKGIDPDLPFDKQKEKVLEDETELAPGNYDQENQNFEQEYPNL